MKQASSTGLDHYSRHHPGCSEWAHIPITIAGRVPTHVAQTQWGRAKLGELVTLPLDVTSALDVISATSLKPADW